MMRTGARSWMRFSLRRSWGRSPAADAGAFRALVSFIPESSAKTAAAFSFSGKPKPLCASSYNEEFPFTQNYRLLRSSLDCSLYPSRDGTHLECRKQVSHLAGGGTRGHGNAG